MIKSKYPIIDAHVHVHPNDLESIGQIVQMVQDADYRAINMLGMTSFKTEACANNISCLLLKKLLPGRVYAFGSFHYPDNGIDLDVDLADYARTLLSMGFDGIKLLEGKPTVRKRINVPLNDSYYDSFYEFAEQNQIPILFHVNDPANFWDREHIPPLALERGNFYGDGTYPSKEEIYGEVDRILEAHPHLNVIWAHFYFLSEEMERARHFLDTYPESRFDITPGPEMYFDFSRHPAEWKEFFETYSSRIILGTDNYNPTWKERINGMTEFLETDCGAIPFFGKTIHGIGLSETHLKNIYEDNFMSFIGGKEPKPVDMELLEEEFSLVEKMAYRSRHKSVILDELTQLRKLQADCIR